jgi:tetratricopeptide (TPR) repeat protein
MRALALCALGSPQAFVAKYLRGLAHFYWADLQPTRALAEEVLEMAVALDDGYLMLEAHRAVGVTFVELGRFSEAMALFERVTMLYGTHRERAQTSFAGHDPKVVSECFAARALWALGYPDRALERCERGLALAGALAHTQSQALSAHFAAHLHQLRGEVSRVQGHAEMLIAFGEEYGLDMWVALGHVHQGWTRVQQGHVEAGIQELQRGLTDYNATGAKLWRRISSACSAKRWRRGNESMRGSWRWQRR